MKSLEILENKLKVYIKENNKLSSDYSKLMREVRDLRQSLNKLKSEREEIKEQLSNIIEKVEIYLNMDR